MRLSVLLEASATRLDTAVNWGDYAPVQEQGSDTGAEPDFSNSDASSSGSSGNEAASRSGRHRFSVDSQSALGSCFFRSCDP